MKGFPIGVLIVVLTVVAFMFGSAVVITQTIQKEPEIEEVAEDVSLAWDASPIIWIAGNNHIKCEPGYGQIEVEFQAPYEYQIVVIHCGKIIEEKTE